MVETITPIPIEDLTLYPDHSRLYEFNPSNRTAHLSGGYLKRIEDLKEDDLTREVLRLHAEGAKGEAILTAAINSFYFNEFEAAHIRSGDTSRSIYLELQKIAIGELARAMDGAAALKPDQSSDPKKLPDSEEKETPETCVSSSEITGLNAVGNKKRRL